MAWWLVKHKDNFTFYIFVSFLPYFYFDLCLLPASLIAFAVMY